MKGRNNIGFEEALKDRHRRFLDHVIQKTGKGTAIYYSKVFNMLLPYEIERGKDIVEFDRKEAQEALDRISTIKEASFDIRRRMLQSYYNFCLENEVLNQQPFIITLKPNFKDTVNNSSASNPKSLQEYLDRTFAPVEDNTVHNIFRTYLWLGFMGVPKSDLMTLKKSDVDLKNLVVHANGKSYPMYEESIPAFDYCVNGKIMTRSPNQLNTVFPRCNDDRLLVTYRDSGQGDLGTTIQTQLSRYFKTEKIDTRITYSTATYSGFNYRIYQAEHDKVNPIDPKAYITNILSEQTGIKPYDLSYPEEERRRLKRVIKTALTDYGRWKQSFYTEEEEKEEPDQYTVDFDTNTLQSSICSDDPVQWFVLNQDEI